MTRQETIKLLAVIAAAYPAFYAKQGEADRMAAVNLWQEMLAGYDYGVVAAAVKAFIATDSKGFPPAVGVIIARIVDITTPQVMDDNQAWQLVRRACKYYTAEEEFSRLPQEIQQVVGSPNQLREWSQMEIGDLENIAGSHFRRIWQARSSHIREQAALPADLREMLQGVAQHLQIGDNHEK